MQNHKNVSLIHQFVSSCLQKPDFNFLLQLSSFRIQYQYFTFDSPNQEKSLQKSICISIPTTHSQGI